MYTIAPFRCQHPGCSAAYRRKEHLNRHATRHAQTERFPCPHCNSILVRRNKEPPPSRAPKACRACHVRKERCDSGSPCNRCQRRRITCSRTRQESEIHDESTVPNAQALLSTELVGPVPDTSRWTGQDFIDIYFRDFHPIWPFLHRGTFDVSKEPCILLQSMVMIGLWIQGGQEGRDTAMTFHLKLLSAIQDQRSQWYISESTPCRDSKAPWPMATYQSILLQCIFALLVAKQETTLDLNLRFQLPFQKYELLASLVETCRRLRLFYYPNMLTKHSSSAPLALVWVSVEEVKRFGLALYKLCRLCTCAQGESGRADTDIRDDSSPSLLTLADLDFCMPDSDEVWNAPPGTGAGLFQSIALQQTCRDNRDSGGWISQTAGRLYDARVRYDWV
ncbi:Zn(II)2Cys6 transcription factor [Aspergillus undulatus]|uniref:Zn(II)2Cys6 transcription factor n=1 Tax=Aspergillus undulatus TaxID=1810928 RepID=UPI003CCE47A4